MKQNESTQKRRTRPATNREARENQIICKAYDLVEKRIDEGTATSQEIVHFLKLGTTKALLEKEKLEKENELLLAKTEAIHSAAVTEELYAEALKAMRSYSGQQDEDD